jgi:hypothetical protein
MLAGDDKGSLESLKTEASWSLKAFRQTQGGKQKSSRSSLAKGVFRDKRTKGDDETSEGLVGATVSGKKRRSRNIWADPPEANLLDVSSRDSLAD